MENLEERLNKIEDKIDAIYASAEKSRKYMLTTLIVTIVVIVLPLLGMALIVPALIDTLGSAYQF